MDYELLFMLQLFKNFFYDNDLYLNFVPLECFFYELKAMQFMC